MSSGSSPRIAPAARNHWKACVDRSGIVRGSWQFFAAIWEFVRDSTPSRLRSRFGDADYDWEFRVNTTSGAVGWRDRLLGVFHSAYQPTEGELFHEMMGVLERETNLNFSDFTFIDLGSGKGRTLLMASNYPFLRIVGVELLPSLDEIARENLAHYQSETQRCFAIKSVCADATTIEVPASPLVIYLFNPFPEPALRRALANLKQSLRVCPRSTYVIYHNPQLESVLTEAGLRRIAGTHQYTIFTAVL